MTRPRSIPALPPIKAEILKGRRQLLVRAIRFKEWYYFRLVSANGKVIAQSEQYTQKHNAKEVLAKYFPHAEIVDLTDESS